MRYATILFDVGDTLVQVPKPAVVYQRLLADHGRGLNLVEVEQILEDTRRVVDEQCPTWVTQDHVLDREMSIRRRALHVDSIIGLAGIDDAEAARRSFFGVYVGTEFFTLFPDVVDTLQALQSAGYRLGIVSNWEHRLLQLCAAHGIDGYFDFAVISEVEGFVKPHAELYRRAVGRAGVSPARILHVGDKMHEDIEGAAQVGIRGVLLDRQAAEIAPYEPRIASLPELLDLLARE